MNRRNFALSWGRKIFFGLSWPLTTLLALVYLRSFILPESFSDWMFFITTYIGHFGVLNALIYFFLYCPVVLISPGYYVARFWSLILIMTLNVFILMDALSFSSYHFHIYSFLSKLYLEEGIHFLLGSSIALIIISVGVFIISLLLWLRGEMVWRHMQGRFSNPVKNWYLFFIAFCFLVGQTIFHYGDIHPKLSEIFPLNQHLPRKVTSHVDNRKFFYPTDNLSCSGKLNPNIIMIVFKEWKPEELTLELMPTVFHMKKHATSYNTHYGTGSDAESGLFSLMYSVPASYMTSVKDTRPAIMDELGKRKYDTISLGNESGEPSSSINDEQTMQKIRLWLMNRSLEEIRPYFLTVHFDRGTVETDKFIREITIALERENILQGSYVLLTGSHSGTDDHRVPMLLASPDRKSVEISNITSHYDVMPSLMQKMWNCKKAFRVASVGQPVETKNREWLLVAGKESYKIIDFKNQVETIVSNGSITDRTASENGQPRHQLIFSALKSMTSFSKPR